MSEPTRQKTKLLELNKLACSYYYGLLYSIIFFLTGLFCLTIGILATRSIYSIADIVGGVLFLIVSYRYLKRFRKK